MLPAGSIVIGAMLATGLLLPRQLPAASSDSPKLTIRIQAIKTSRSGEFRNCYKLLLFFGTQCSTRHVALPEHITVGDNLVLTYGSNQKHHGFHVGQIIRREDVGCTILRDSSQATDDDDAIEVADCQPAGSD